MKLIFATNNKYKVDEVRGMLDSSVTIVTLQEAGITVDIPEPHDSLEANAVEKSTRIVEMIADRSDVDGCFSEDTGLEVDALGGEPGVYSARYAGDERSDEKNIGKLLAKLEGETIRSARFRTFISLILNGEQTVFEGICPGRILQEKQGTGGFGYDPVFVPDGAEKSFGEMSQQEKSRYSHRARAIEKLVAFLNQQGSKK